MTHEEVISIHKVLNVFEKYLELQRAVRALTNPEYQMLIKSLEHSLKEEKT